MIEGKMGLSTQPAIAGWGFRSVNVVETKMEPRSLASTIACRRYFQMLRGATKSMTTAMAISTRILMRVRLQC